MEAMSSDTQVTTEPGRLTRAAYEELVAQGVFDGQRVELVFGEVVAMSPIDPTHCAATSELHEYLMLALRGRAKVLCQMPIAASDDSEPEPDVYVAPLGDYWKRLPSRAHLVIEVARSSLAYDRGDKSLLYSIAEVDEYWIVDLGHRLVEVHRDRDGRTWRSVATYRPGDTIRLLAFPDVGVAVADVLPPT